VLSIQVNGEVLTFFKDEPDPDGKISKCLSNNLSTTLIQEAVDSCDAWNKAAGHEDGGDCFVDAITWAT
jgi:hypothetical protein